MARILKSLCSQVGHHKDRVGERLAFMLKYKRLPFPDYKLHYYYYRDRIRNYEDFLKKMDLLPAQRDDFMLLNILLTGGRTFYDTEWQIIILNMDNQVEKLDLTRFDMEDKLSFLPKVLCCNTQQELLSLNERDKIYYD